MAQYRSPAPLNFEEPKWDLWKAQFLTFRKVTKLETEAEDVQIASLKYCMGYEAEEVFKTFGLTATEEKKWDTVLRKYDEYFKPKTNIIRLRRIFQRRMQQHNESIEAYLRALYITAEDCDFGTLKKERIRDQFVAGIQDEKLAEKLEHLYMTMSDRNDFTLDRVMEYTRTYCDVIEGRRIEKHEGQRFDISSVKQSSNQIRKEAANEPLKKPCSYCSTKHDYRKCPAYGKRCSSCGRLHHFARACRQRQRGQHVEAVTAEQDGDDTQHMFLGECTDNILSNDWSVDLILNNDIRECFKVDTGADVNILNYFAYSKLIHKTKLHGSTKKLITPAGELEYIGVINVNVSFKSIHLTTDFYVLPPYCKTKNLLSRDTASKLHIVKFVGEVGIPIDEALFGFGKWNTGPVEFHLKADAVPFAVHSSRKIPFNLMIPVRDALNKMLEQDIIEEVKLPTNWASAIVPVVKPGGKGVRICVDFRKLNLSLKRETFHIPTFDELSSRLAGVKFITKLDAASGFFQIPLHENSRDFTTFLTPFGRYRFKRLPMGVNIAPEIYQRKMCELLHDIDNVLIYMDDVIVFGNSSESHDNTLKIVLERIKVSGLRLNKEKCEFKKERIEFLGHIISNDGISISPDKIEAIKNLKQPKSVSELRRVLGLVNFVTKFIPNAQMGLHPLNELLKKDNDFLWDVSHAQAFSRIKTVLSSAPALAYFDPSKPITVSADSSSYAMGGVLMQKENGIFRAVAYWSRSLQPSERGYAQIERELLASVSACEKFDMYLRGVEFILETDHKPLISLIKNKILCDAPVRCQRLLMRLMRYSPRVEYVPGKRMAVADTLSRDVLPMQGECNRLARDICAYEIQTLNSWPASESRLQNIKKEQDCDDEIKRVKKYIVSEWPESAKIELPIYYKCRNEFSVVNGMLLYDDRIVIPVSMKSEILKRVHDDGHLSLNKCRKRVQQSVWWPGISQHLSEYIDKCNFCQTYRKQNRSEPMKFSKLPERPWIKLGMDLFEMGGDNYLIVVDYFSRWFETVKLRDITSESVIKSLKLIFLTFGIPEVIVSDRGLQFTSLLFRQFSEDFGFVHVLSDPYYPQGNGCAERAVQVAKRLLKQSDPHAAFMAYRTTPLDTTGFSPAQLLMGRNIRTKLPLLPEKLKPEWPNFTEVEQNDVSAKIRSANDFNRRNGARKLPEIKQGEAVRVRLPQDRCWSIPDNVLARGGDTSYAVRNRRHLQKIPEIPIKFSDSRSGEDQQLAGGEEAVVPGGGVEPNAPPAKPIDQADVVLKTRYGRIVKPVIKYQA